MPNIEDMDITLNAGRITETVREARAQIEECRSLYRDQLCILCTARVAAIAALETGDES